MGLPVRMVVVKIPPGGNVSLVVRRVVTTVGVVRLVVTGSVVRLVVTGSEVRLVVGLGLSVFLLVIVVMKVMIWLVVVGRVVNRTVVVGRGRVTVEMIVGTVVRLVEVVLGVVDVEGLLVIVVMCPGPVVVGRVWIVVILVVMAGLLLVVGGWRQALVVLSVDHVMRDVLVGLLVEVTSVWSRVGSGQWQNACWVSVTA